MATTTTVPTTAVKDDLTHGGPAWSVYLAVVPWAPGSFDAPALVASKQQVEALSAGYEPGEGDLACDRGAAAALGLDPRSSFSSTALYFDTEADAQRFVDRYEPEVAGIALIRTRCMD